MGKLLKVYDYSVEIRNKYSNDKLAYAKIISAKSATLAKQYIIKLLGIGMSRSEYTITATKLRRK